MGTATQMQPDLTTAASGELDRLAAEERTRLLRFAQRFSPPGEAEDVLQEALMLAWRGIGYWKGNSSVCTWLHTIIRNTGLGFRRKGFYRYRETPVEFPEPVCDPHGSASVDVELILTGLPSKHTLAVRERLAFGENSSRIMEARHCHEVRRIRKRLGLVQAGPDYR